MDKSKPQLSDKALKDLAILAQKAGLLHEYENLGIIPSCTDKALEKFITNDKDMLAQKNLIRKYAPLPYPVLILGDTGTGKELFARALHGSREGKFVAVNITALPSELVESELFGHTKGSFTGATNDRPGLFQDAQNGTLFLDEIGYMPKSAQAKLLRVIEEKKVRMLGSNDYTSINCRIVCATRLNLTDQIERDAFLPDLYWRLQYLIIKTKPLRARREDIYEILDSMFDPEGKIPQDVRDKWTTTESFFGNVRELEAMAIRYIVNL